MSKSTARVVVLGMAGRSPFAGVAWQALHYLEGLRRLGCDVYYVEDTGEWPYDPEQNAVTDDPRYTVGYIARLMAWWGMPERWAYRAASQDGRVYGLSACGLATLFDSADLLINLTGATTLREEHLRVPVRVYLETDPVLPQVRVARGDRETIDRLDAHTHHFTYAENLGALDCGVPTGRYTYLPTRQPIVLDWWQPADEDSTPGTAFTTVASWQQSGNDLEWNGETYHWSKHREFLKLIDLPSRRPSQRFELALACGNGGAAGFDEAVALLRAHGWRVTDGLALSKDILPYRDYVRCSHGEFTVAKDQNIRLRSGWFSDRSASYLAAGRPVITQDTAFGAVLPVGKGLFAFRTMDGVLAAIDAVAGDYEGNRRAAREIAHQYFAAEKVVGEMMCRLG